MSCREAHGKSKQPQLRGPGRTRLCLRCSCADDTAQPIRQCEAVEATALIAPGKAVYLKPLRKAP